MTSRNSVNFIQLLAESGRDVPRSSRERELRNQALLRAGKVHGFDLTDEGLEPRFDKVVREPLQWRRMVVSFAIAVGMLLAAGIFSFSVMNCMPGHPLYSSKRVLENTRVALLTGRDARAREYLTQAEDRIAELGYVRARHMRSWYYPLASAAGSRIESASREMLAGGSNISTVNEDSEKSYMLITARDDLYELQGIVRGLSAELNGAETAAIQKTLSVAISRLDKVRPADPSAENVRNGGPADRGSSTGADKGNRRGATSPAERPSGNADDHASNNNANTDGDSNGNVDGQQQDTSSGPAVNDASGNNGQDKNSDKQQPASVETEQVQDQDNAPDTQSGDTTDSNGRKNKTVIQKDKQAGVSANEIDEETDENTHLNPGKLLHPGEGNAE